LIKKGQYREIKFIIDKGEPPEFLKKPKPWLNEKTAPPSIREKIQNYESSKSTEQKEEGESIIGLLIKGFKNLLKGTRLGG